jgi:hypothetical protein
MSKKKSIEQVETMAEFEQTTNYIFMQKPHMFTLQEMFAYGRAMQYEFKYDGNRAMKDIAAVEAIELAKIVGWPSLKERSIRDYIRNPGMMTVDENERCVWCVSIGTEMKVDVFEDDFMVYYVGFEHQPCSISMQSYIRAWIYLRSIDVKFDLHPRHEVNAIKRVSKEDGTDPVKISGSN